LPEPSKRLERAEASLRSAELLLQEGLYRDSASRAYYAMFHAARALLASKDSHPRTHGGVLREVSRSFVQPGLLDRSFAGDLGYALQLRQRADYEDDLVVTEADARDVLERARRFVSQARQLLQE
jgi:hypothetical protein